MQKIRSTCRERPISSRARCFSPRCSWQPGLNNPRSHRTRLVRFPTSSHQKVHRPQRSRRSLIPKKMFEQPVTEGYLECCDTSPLSKRGRVRVIQSLTPNMNARALHGGCDCDLFLVRDLESLRVRGSGDQDPLGANRMPVPFQTGKAKAGALAVTMLQNSTRSCFRPNKKLGPG